MESHGAESNVRGRAPLARSAAPRASRSAIKGGQSGRLSRSPREAYQRDKLRAPGSCEPRAHYCGAACGFWGARGDAHLRARPFRARGRFATLWAGALCGRARFYGFTALQKRACALTRPLPEDPMRVLRLLRAPRLCWPHALWGCTALPRWLLSRFSQRR